MLILGLYAILSVVLSWPLARHWATFIGGWYGDGPRFLWNLWWFDRSLEAGTSPLWTELLFHPLGADLTLHTLTLLHGLAARPLTPVLGLIGAQNALFLLGGVLAAWGTYRLCLELTGDPWASVVGGVIFGFSPFHAIRGLGHMNLTATYGLPMVAWGLVRTSRRGGLSGPVWAGLWLGTTLYVSYYYFVYAGLLALLMVAYLPLLLGREVRLDRWHRVGTGLLAAGLIGVVLVAISGRLEAAGERPILRSSFQGPGRILLAGLVLRSVGLLRSWIRGLRGGIKLRRRLLLLALAGTMGLLLALPLLSAVAGALAGDTGQRPDRLFSRIYSADLLSFGIPPPWHSLTGGRLATLLEETDAGIEGWTYQGWLPLLLGGAALWRLRRKPWVRFWGLVAATSLVLALGPALQVGGETLLSPGRGEPMRLPFDWFLHLPWVGGARGPARFCVVLGLALSALTSLCLARLPGTPGRRRLVSGAVLLGVVLDFALLPMAVQEQPVTPLVERIAREAGRHQAVLDLPLEISSGTNAIGMANPGMFHRQTVHGRPLIGGHRSRSTFLPFQYYQSAPLTAAVLALQDASIPMPELSPADRAELRRGADELALGHVLMDRGRYREPARTNMIALVGEVLGFQLVGEDGWLALWRNPRLEGFSPGSWSTDLTRPWSAHGDATPFGRRTPRGLEILREAAELRFRLEPEPGPYRFQVDAHCLGDRPRRMMVRLNGNPAGSCLIRPEGSQDSFRIPPDRLRPGWNRLSIQPDPISTGSFPVGETGHHLEHPIQIHSTFYNLRKPPGILLGGRPAFRCERGFNLAVLSPDGSRPMATFHYFSNEWRRRDRELDRFLESVPDGAVVALCLWDNGECRLTQRSRELLTRLGGEYPIEAVRQGAYALLGVMGAPPGTALEAKGDREAYLELPSSRVVLERVQVTPDGPVDERI